MTVTTTNAITGPYLTNGSTVAFPFDFTAPSDSELIVLLVDSDDVSTTVDPVDYTVTRTTSGGTVTFATAPATSQALYILLDPSMVSEITFPQGGAWLAAAINEANDRAVLRDQRLQHDINRAFLLPRHEIGVTVPSATARANSLLGFGAAGAAGIISYAALAAGIADYLPDNLKGDPGSPGEGYATKAALATALNDATNLDDFYLSASGVEGKFIFSTADHSAKVALDTDQGMYIAPASDPTGASGAAIRVYGGLPQFSWWAPDVTGATDVTAKLEMAFAVLGACELDMGIGTYLLSSWTPPDGVTLRGHGFSDYERGTTFGLTNIKRETSANEAVILAGVNYFTAFDINFDGNGGKAANAADISVTGSGAGKNCVTFCDGSDICDHPRFYRCKFYDGHWGVAGHASNYIGGGRFVDCSFIANNIGSAYFRDTLFENCTWSGNQQYGGYNNGGQNRIIGGFSEWNFGNVGGGVCNAAHGFYFGPNSNETYVTDMQFDHNSGNDIVIGTSGNVPEWFHFNDNFFKGAMWATGTHIDGTAINKADRCAIRVIGGGTLRYPNFSGSTFQRRNHNPSAIEGYRAPLYAADLGAAEDVVLTAVNAANCTPVDDISAWRAGTEFLFLQSASGTNEFYLQHNATDGGNPWMIQPDWVTYNGVALSLGTLGSLALNEYAFGNNDSLTGDFGGTPTAYDALYVRLPGTAADPDPNADTGVLKCGWNLPTFDLSDAKHVKTERHLDQRQSNISATSTSTFYLKTHRPLEGTFSIESYVLEVTLREGSAGGDSFFEVPFILARGAAAGATVKEGTITELERGTGPTLAWATAGATDLEITVRSDALGEAIWVDVENTLAAVVKTGLRLR